MGASTVFRPVALPVGSPPQRPAPSASPPRRGPALLTARGRPVLPTGHVLGGDPFGAIPDAGGEALRPPPPQVPLPPPTAGPPERRQRKERGPNWGLQEILALVAAKREEFLDRQQVTDARELFDPETSHWQRISLSVMRAGLSPVVRDAGACKTKWNLLVPDYRRIADSQKRTGTNEQVYWTMPTAEKREQRLPNFSTGRCGRP
jgi:hypothetical protein